MTKSIPLKQTKSSTRDRKTVLTTSQQLMRKIMHYYGDFRREETTSVVGSSVKH